VQAFGIEEVCDATGYSRRKLSRATHAAAQPRFVTVHNIVRGMGAEDQICSGKKVLMDELSCANNEAKYQKNFLIRTAVD
jgi:hypothetical protein